MTVNPELQKNNLLLGQFKETRNRTLELVKNLKKDDFVVSNCIIHESTKVAYWSCKLDL